MPKSFSMDNLAFSIRLPPITALWLEEQAKKVGSFNQAVRDVLDDAQTLYGLPDVMTERLDAEQPRWARAGAIMWSTCSRFARRSS